MQSKFEHEWSHLKKGNKSRINVSVIDHSKFIFNVFLSIIILITETYKTKKYYNHQLVFYISSTWEKGKKQTKTIWNRNKNEKT